MRGGLGGAWRREMDEERTRWSRTHALSTWTWTRVQSPCHDVGGGRRSGAHSEDDGKADEDEDEAGCREGPRDERRKPNHEARNA